MLLACVLPLGGWLVVAPALSSHVPAPPEPAIDLDGTALHAPLAADRQADEPSGRVVLASAASAASGAADDKLRCGGDQAPQYKTPEAAEDGIVYLEEAKPDPDGVLRHFPGEIKPAGVGYTGAMRRIDAALRASADPFDRAMADWLDLAEIMPPAIRVEALAQDALAVADPRVYGLAWQACRPWLSSPYAGQPAPGSTPACARLSASEWARLDPGNALPWLYALEEANKAGDDAAQREALRRMADSTRVEARSNAGAAAVARLQMARDADLSAQSTAVGKALGASIAPYGAVATPCRNHAGGDPDRAATCARVAELMFNHSDTFISRNLGGAVHKLLTDDTSWLDRAHREQHQAGARWNETVDGKVVDSGPCADARGFMRHIARLDAVGELVLAEQARSAASAP